VTGSWTWDVPAAGLSAAGVVAYVAGVGAVRRAGHPWPIRRGLGFAAGVLTIVLATCSPVGSQARSQLAMLTVQVCLLLMVCPLLVGAGQPLSLLRAVRGAGDRREPCSVGIATTVARLLRAPGVGPLLLVATTCVVLFVEPVTTVMVAGPLGYQVMHLLLLGVGLAAALPVTEEAGASTSVAYAAIVGLGFLEFLLDAVPGISLRLLGHPLGITTWLATRRAAGPTPMDDQHLAGAWLWFFAEAGDIPFLVAAVLAWTRADAREARRIDALLDQAEADGTPSAQVGLAFSRQGAGRRNSRVD